MAQEYYYGQMSREEQEAYRGMFAGFCEIASEISVRRLDNRQLSDVFFHDIRMNCFPSSFSKYLVFKNLIPVPKTLLGSY